MKSVNVVILVVILNVKVVSGNRSCVTQIIVYRLNYSTGCSCLLASDFVLCSVTVSHIHSEKCKINLML